ncbi:amyloid-beta A4 precursor protein-binding family A member 3-like [Neosynchiropus ocellatus]
MLPDAESLVRALESYRGRDKVIRTICYGSQLIGGVLSCKADSDVSSLSLGKSLLLFSAQLGHCRTVLRLFDDLSMLAYSRSYGLGNGGEDPAVRLISVLTNVTDQLYYPCEHVAWAADTKLIRAKSDTWWLLSNVLWGTSLLLGIFRSLRILLLLKKKMKKSEQEEAGCQHFCQLRKEMQAELLSIISSMADISNSIHWMPQGFLWGGRFPTWLVGLMGTVSSLIMLIQWNIYGLSADRHPSVHYALREVRLSWVVQFGFDVITDGASKVNSSRLEEDLDSYNPIEPPPFDWRSDSSIDSYSEEDGLDSGFPPSVDNGDMLRPAEESLAGNVFVDLNQHKLVEADIGLVHENKNEVESWNIEYSPEELQDSLPNNPQKSEIEFVNPGTNDDDHSRIQTLLSQLQLVAKEPHPSLIAPPFYAQHPDQSQPEACSSCSLLDNSNETNGLIFTESYQRDQLGVLACTEIGCPPQADCLPQRGEVDAVVSVSYGQKDVRTFRDNNDRSQRQRQREDSVTSQPEDVYPEPVWMKLGEEPPAEQAAHHSEQSSDGQPSYKDVPGPCDPEDLLDGVIFGAKYLGSTQIKSDRNPSTNARMSQAQEAVDRIKAPEGESQPMTEVDLFISTQRIKVLSADSQEAMMDHALQMISYIADIGEIVVLLARRNRKGQIGGPSSSSCGPQRKCLMICHVFCSKDAQTIAQSIGQAFGVAYQQFLQAHGIKASDLRPGEYSDYLESQELYNGDLAHFSDSQNLREVVITKAAGEILGLAVVESGWGSILPTVVVANLLHGGPAERCGELSIGDRIMSVNGTSMVGLPISTCQNILRDLKSQKYVKLSIVHCPPVTLAIIRRPDSKFQLGFTVEDGIICSLMRGGIAERGGIRVGHRIIEINGQSVVATPHEKVIQILTNAIGEIHLKTMPTSTYRLLTGQEQPVFL